jgi:hypothetical protein
MIRGSWNNNQIRNRGEKDKRFKVVVTDYDFRSVEIERRFLNRVNADLLSSTTLKRNI